MVQLFALQTDEIVVRELRGRNHLVPVTLIREKGTYGSVTVNFQVRGHNSNREEKHRPNTQLYSLLKGQLVFLLVCQFPDDDEDDMSF